MKKIITYKEFLNESKSAIVTEANQEEQIKKEVISKLSDFFGCAPGDLSKFNFDGKDNIKELTKALRSTSDEGTAQYYRIAIIMAKRDLGIHESEEFELNEAVSTPEELASFISKEEKHFAAFLKPKKISASVNGKVVTIKPGSGSFTITVDFAKSTIDTTGKPEWPESTSYVELMEYIKITKFKLNESVDTVSESTINEGEVNYKTDKYALVLVGGSIGSKDSFPLFVSGQMGSIMETSNDKEALVEAKKRRNKQLSPGEKKYYRMSYKVIELTSNKIKEIDLLISKQSSSEDTIIDESDESEVNEKAMDTKYWSDYNDDAGVQGQSKHYSDKSTDFEDTFEDAVSEWNAEAEGAENRIKGAQIKTIKKLAQEFFKIEKWISVNVIQAMIMQES